MILVSLNSVQQGAKILLEDGRKGFCVRLFVLEMFAIILLEFVIAESDLTQKVVTINRKMRDDKSMPLDQASFTGASTTGGGNSLNLTQLMHFVAQSGEGFRSASRDDENVSTVSINITASEQEPVATSGSKSNLADESAVGPPRSLSVSNSTASATITTTATSSSPSSTTTTSTTRRPTLSARSRWFLNQIRKRRKLKVIADPIEEVRSDGRANFTASASQNHEDWVNFDSAQPEDKTATSKQVSRRVASLISKKNGLNEEGNLDAEEDQSASSSSHDEKPLVSKSTTTTTTIGDGRNQAKLINKSGARLPPGLKRKIIEQFVKAGGNPNNIVVSDSTITTTSQSKKKTVTTVYKLEPTSGIMKSTDRPLMRAIKVTQNPSMFAKSKPATHEILERPQLPEAKSLTNLLGNPKRAQVMKKPAQKVKRIMVTRTEVPAMLTSGLTKFGKEPELGEFYRGPHETILGDDQRLSADQKAAIMNLDKMIELGPSKPMDRAKPRQVKPASLMKAVKMQQAPHHMKDQVKTVGGSKFSLYTLTDLMNIKTPFMNQRLSNFKDVKLGQELPNKKASEQGEQIVRSNSTTAQKLGQLKRDGSIDRDAITSRVNASKRSPESQDVKGDSLTELKRSVLSMSSKRLQGQNKVTSSTTAAPARLPIPATPPQPRPTKTPERPSSAKLPAKVAASTTSRPTTTSTASSPTTTTTSTSTTSTTAAPREAGGQLGKPKTHNIMMLIDFGAKDGEVGRDQPLDKAATWRATSNSWQPVDYRGPRDAELRGSLAKEANTPTQSVGIHQIPAVNVQIYNGLRAAGPTEPSDYNMDELGESSLTEPATVHQMVAGDSRSSDPGPFLKTNEMRFEQVDASQPIDFRAATTNSQFSSPATQEQPSPAYNLQAEPTLVPMQAAPLNSGELDQLILPGESASTNQLVRQVINQLAMSSEPLKVSASEAQDLRHDQPAYYTTTSVQDPAGEGDEDDGEMLSNEEPVLLGGGGGGGVDESSPLEQEAAGETGAFRPPPATTGVGVHAPAGA